MEFRSGFLRVIVAVLLLAGVPGGAEAGGTASADGAAYLAREEYAKAARSFAQAIGRGDRSAGTYAGLGRAYLKLGDNQHATDMELLEKGVAALRTAEELDPARAETHYDLGLTLLALGDRTGAAREIEHLKQLDQGLTASLTRALEGHRPPPSYRLIGESGSPEKNGTPIIVEGNTVLVPVTLSLGSRNVQARLILDTGASMTTITPPVAAQLDINLNQAVSGAVQVVGGGFVEARGVRLDQVSVGPHVRTKMNVAVIGNGNPRVPYDGLLGMDFLRGLHYHVDFRNRVITWTP
ncbi:MAG TPA: aspartyl protease family protein [Geomobilimonas sp.]|nr:aspartyl protease family protein [Geomobilimonas sp.]